MLPAGNAGCRTEVLSARRELGEGVSDEVSWRDPCRRFSGAGCIRIASNED